MTSLRPHVKTATVDGVRITGIVFPAAGTLFFDGGSLAFLAVDAHTPVWADISFRNNKLIVSQNAKIFVIHPIDDEIFLLFHSISEHQTKMKRFVIMNSDTLIGTLIWEKFLFWDDHRGTHRVDVDVKFSGKEISIVNSYNPKKILAHVPPIHNEALLSWLSDPRGTT